MQHGEDKIRGEKGNKAYRNQKPGKHGENEITVYNSDEKLRENKVKNKTQKKTRGGKARIICIDLRERERERERDARCIFLLGNIYLQTVHRWLSFMTGRCC